ncbi:acetyltransferase, GNAT family [Oesophagostomum dentatum]|uniref:Acetyltransferase, GNAT family n=1 Tax=Oesophagostomum dentatum TaxID=61180 RepID=A0A0B1T070_OESDE|nr:acetyltransferase, GNAT family [Oesophagostomum dentatum]
MGPKSLDQVEILHNPDKKYWCKILEPMAYKEEWAFIDEDYTTWLNSSEEFSLFVAVDKETGEPIGCVTSGLDHSISGKRDEDLRSVGMYYVKEEWRGSGVGTALFTKVIENAKGSNMALHGVLKMSPKYASKYGFDKMSNCKYDFAMVPTEHITVPQANEKYAIKDFSDVSDSQLAAYDATISQRNRLKYLKNFMTTGKCYAQVALDSSDTIVGLCSIRAVKANTLCTGPLYADNEDIARSLLAGVLPMIEDIKNYKYLGSLYPSTNRQAQSLFESIGGGHTKIEAFTQPAFTKKVLPVPEVRVFGILECANSFV